MNVIKIKRDTKPHDEIQSLLESKHPYLVEYVLPYAKPDNKYLYMPLDYDCHLETYVKNQAQQGLPERLVLKWTYQLGLALDYLHYKRIIHSNVHEQNIWLTNEEDCKLSNFGFLETEDQFKYSSPELLPNRKLVTHKSDMWALGCVIHFMCTSQQPFLPQQEATPEPKKAPRISQESYSSDLQAIIDDLLEYNVMSRLGADELVLKDVFKTIRDSCKEYLPKCQSKRIDLHVDAMDFEKSMNNLKKQFAMDKNVIMKCDDKDLVLLIGDTGSGKSTLYSYLKGIPLKEYTANELNILSQDPYKMYIEVEDLNKKPVSVIGHGIESTTETPNILVIDEMIICDCPGFKATQGIEILLSNAVKIQTLIKNARSCKLIVVVPFNDIAHSRLTPIRDVTELVKRMFSCEEMREEHKASVSICITNLPKRRKRETPQNVSEFRKYSLYQLIQSISANDVLIYDPLNRTNRLYYPIPSRDELLEQIKIIPHLENPKKVLGLGVSDKEKLAIINYEVKTVDLVTELLKSDETVVQAARIYQLFYSFKVLEHETVITKIAQLKECVEMIFKEKSEKIAEMTQNMGKENARNVIVKFGEIRMSFFKEGNEEILENMWNNYTRNRWKTVWDFLQNCLKMTSRFPTILHLPKISDLEKNIWFWCWLAYSGNETFASPLEALKLIFKKEKTVIPKAAVN